MQKSFPRPILMIDPMFLVRVHLFMFSILYIRVYLFILIVTFNYVFVSVNRPVLISCLWVFLTIIRFPRSDIIFRLLICSFPTDDSFVIQSTNYPYGNIPSGVWKSKNIPNWTNSSNQVRFVMGLPSLCCQSSTSAVPSHAEDSQYNSRLNLN